MATSVSVPRLQTQTYSRRELADVLGISERHLDKLTSQGKIPGVIRLGGSVKYSRPLIDAMIEGKSTK